jgi:hypothetical protein
LTDEKGREGFSASEDKGEFISEVKFRCERQKNNGFLGVGLESCSACVDVPGVVVGGSLLGEEVEAEGKRNLRCCEGRVVVVYEYF